MSDPVQELMEIIFEGEIRTLGSLWERAGWENAASYARDISGIKLEIMDDDVGILRTELAILIRKLFQRNLFVQEEVDSIIRGLRYEETLARPPRCDLH